MKRLLPAVLFAAVLAVPSPPASAITFGELDGGRHPNVGALLYEYDVTNPGLDPACSGTLIRNDTQAVVLTAWHCDPDFETNGDVVYVSFDQDVKPVTSSRPSTGAASTATLGASRTKMTLRMSPWWSSTPGSRVSPPRLCRLSASSTA